MHDLTMTPRLRSGLRYLRSVPSYEVMARRDERLPGNADGSLYVDSSCIDCAVCRIVAPDTFVGSGATSLVACQPRSPRELLRAKMALVSCPTSSIGMQDKVDLDDAVAAFPEPLGDDVYFCGFASESSYGAQSYLLVRPKERGGNVLVDSPRAVPRLLDRIEALGGVSIMFLTHRDDVADHAKIARRFGATRVIHEGDVTRDTRDVERIVQGDDPVRLDDDLVVVPVPGHTKGSAALLHRDLALFTGDHLFATEDGRSLYAARSVCWWSWKAQVASLEKLLAFDFRRVLPGHEGRMQCASAAEMRSKLRDAIEVARGSS
jgi:glyoxylase-like metal-dependent hydrolase (beta-lactamase superfamily II)/ferredoxin